MPADFRRPVLWGDRLDRGLCLGRRLRARWGQGLRRRPARPTRDADGHEQEGHEDAAADQNSPDSHGSEGAARATWGAYRWSGFVVETPEGATFAGGEGTALGDGRG
jgi:hypothetical protein